MTYRTYRRLIAVAGLCVAILLVSMAWGSGECHRYAEPASWRVCMESWQRGGWWLAAAVGAVGALWAFRTGRR